MQKKEIFKLLIKEFQEYSLPGIIERELEIPLKSQKIITVFGPRRSGKSYYFYGIINKLLLQGIEKERILYLSFEDDRLFPLDLKELGELTEAYFELYPENKNKQVYFFFDEIQNIANWELFVRRIYDKEKAKIFITGSSSKLLSREIATALRGRTLSFALHPLNFREFLKFKNKELIKDYTYSGQRFEINKLLQEYLEFGGFPEITLAKTRSLKSDILKEYFDLLVFRDLAERFNIGNTGLLKDILKFLFTNITSLFSINAYYKNVKQSMPSSRDAIHVYLEYIKETGYFSLLPCWSYSLKEQKNNPLKIIALDNGLRNKIALKFSPDTGKLAENIVGQDLINSGNEIYYWKNKKEVDFVVKNNRTLEAINVSYGNIINKREIESLLEFKRENKKVRKLILINKNINTIENNIQYITLDKWLIEKKEIA